MLNPRSRLCFERQGFYRWLVVLFFGTALCLSAACSDMADGVDEFDESDAGWNNDVSDDEDEEEQNEEEQNEEEQNDEEQNDEEQNEEEQNEEEQNEEEQNEEEQNDEEQNDADPECADNRELCGDICVDWNTDPDHCGGCDQVCLDDEACTGGSCQLVCASGETDCFGQCVDTSTDDANCGSCGNSCGTDEECTGGSCQLVCASGETDCFGQCVDTSTDDANCGSCGNSCGTDEECTGGTCDSTGCSYLSDPSCPLDCTDESTWPDVWLDYADDVIDLVNDERAAGADCNGTSMPPVSSVSADSALEEASRCHSLDMSENNFMSHTGSDGSTFSQRAYDAGYTGFAAGENVASGQFSPSAVVNAWMNSEGHCMNIMNGSITEMGIGYADVDGRRWTMKLGM